jgi:TP901 family phage tail tape measure protein
MSRVRGGQVFVEIGADPRRLFKSLQDLNKHIGKIGSQLSGLGTRMTAFGAALTAPLALATRQFASFDDVLRNTQASTGASASQLDQIRKAALAMSEALGVGPTEAAQGFQELLKAGMSLEQVLGGAGSAAISFAKVGGLAVADAAVVMSDAMNVFKVSGDVAANTLSAAADASSSSIEGIAQSFSQVSAVAGLANQSIADTAASLAILANAGIKGSDAGTSLKTMLLRLMAPADDAVGALKEIGLSVDSFRGADGTMKPMVDILRTLSGSLRGMDQAAKDDVFSRIFGSDAIRAAAVMTTAGVDGFDAMRQSMSDALPVGEKFRTMSGGLSGAASAMLASLQRLAISIGDALAPSLQFLVEGIGHAASTLTTFVKNNQEMVVGVAKGIATFTAIGAAILGMGAALSAVAAAFGLVLSPIGLIVAGVVGLVVAVDQATGVLGQLAGIASTTFGGIYDALAAGDLELAMEIMWAGVQAALLRGVNAVMTTIDSWVAFLQNTFTYTAAILVSHWESLWSGIVQVLNVNKAIVLGVVDNIVNGIMASFDAMVAAVRKSWNWVQSFIVKGYDLAEENAKVDSEMDARARQREASRPGITGRVSAALEENKKTAAETQSRIDGIKSNAADIAQGRRDENERRRLERDGQAEALEGRVGELRQTAADRRVVSGQVGELDRSLGSVTSMEELQKLAATFRELRDSGKLSAEQLDRLETSLDAASERVMEAGLTSSDTRKAAAAGAAAAEASTVNSSAEVAGTFSGAALGQFTFGSNLAQKQLEKLAQIEENTRQPMAGLVAD